MGNPIIQGYYADPDIRYFEGRYYIYPTTDGGKWHGTSFKCFSSENLKDWTDHGEIFNITWNSKWAKDFAWAPTVGCKNGKYYLYYCAEKNIGVAVSNHPYGPFENLSVEEPFLSMEKLENGVTLDQVIDPYIMVDHDGRNYLYFGNSKTPAVLELEDDMHTIVPGSMKNIVYEGEADCREAFMAVYEQGRYHFTWSCDDTRSEDYHVNYGISDSPTGPVKVLGTILHKNVEKNILGTGHHGMLKDPVTGKYLMAYHRFSHSLPDGVTGWDRGMYREICLDWVEMSEDGLFKKVQVSL